MADFLAYDKIACKYVLILCGAATFSSIMFLIMIGMKLRDDIIIRKYKLDASLDVDLQFICEYSEDGELKVFENGCRISRQGNYVSNLLNNILSITCNNDSSNRIMSVTYEDSEKDSVKTEKIQCGNMNDTAYTRIREYMLQYSGG